MQHSAGPLVIFDCDGVLVDSEPVSVRVLVDALRRKGVEMDAAEAYSRFLGRSLGTVTKTMREEFGVEADNTFLEDMRRDLYARFRAELQPMPGIADALDALDFRRCVASSSQPERIRLSLSLTGLIDKLEPNIFSATMVEKGKPAPDLFLHAASEMGADPKTASSSRTVPPASRRATAPAWRYSLSSAVRMPPFPATGSGSMRFYRKSCLTRCRI